MRKEDLFEALSGLDDDIVEGAKATMNKRMNWKAVKTVLVAAILTIALAVPAAAYTIETVRYNAAVEYLKSLGIDVVDLSDYSKKEVIRAVEVYDAYDTEAVAEDNTFIKSLLPNDEYVGRPKEPTCITSEQVRQLTPTMTLTDVTEKLGATQDIGSGICILVYKVDDKYTLTIPFAGLDAQLGVTGEDLLKALQPIDEP